MAAIAVAGVGLLCISSSVASVMVYKGGDKEDTAPATTPTAAEKAQAKADALTADPDATPAEVAAAQAAAAAAADAAADDTEEETPAAVNCVGTWSGWGDCSQDCGGGIQTKEWATTTEPLHGGTVCPSPSTETQVCNEQACPVATNCIGAWSGWGACSETCGGGIQSQNYEVSTDETNGGTCTERGQTNEKPCNEQACPIGDNGFDNETFYIKDVEGRYVGSDNWSNRNIMGLGGYNYPKTSYTLDGSLDETTIQTAGKYCLGWDNRINCSSDSAEDNGNFRLEKQSDGGFKIYNEGLGEYYIGAVKDENIFTQTLGKYAGQQTGEVLYPDYDGEELMNMTFFLEKVP